jgi:hypothetical protein
MASSDVSERREKLKKATEELKTKIPKGYKYIFVGGHLPGDERKHLVTLLKHEKEDGTTVMTADCTIEGELDPSASDKARIDQLWEGKYTNFHNASIFGDTVHATHAKRQIYMCMMAHGLEPQQDPASNYGMYASDRAYRRDRSHHHNDSIRFQNGSVLPSDNQDNERFEPSMDDTQDQLIESRVLRSS